ncbi:MAG: ComF family protein [Cyanobacteriota bacterium]
MFFKKKCLLCSRIDDKLICISCYNQFQKIKEPFCIICKSNINISDKNNQCVDCNLKKPLFSSLITIGAYNGLLRGVIYNLKYDGIKKLSDPLGFFLANKIKEEINYKKIDFVTSIPVSLEKLKKRGFNQAELIALSVAKNLILPYKEILIRHRETEAQHSLSKQERSENLKEAFSIKAKVNLKNKTVLIIDDIFTTGATIQENCMILKEGNVSDIYVGVVSKSLM